MLTQPSFSYVEEQHTKAVQNGRVLEDKMVKTEITPQRQVTTYIDHVTGDRKEKNLRDWWQRLQTSPLTTQEAPHVYSLLPTTTSPSGRRSSSRREEQPEPRPVAPPTPYLAAQPVFIQTPPMMLS